MFEDHGGAVKQGSSQIVNLTFRRVSGETIFGVCVDGGVTRGTNLFRFSHLPSQLPISGTSFLVDFAAVL